MDWPPALVIATCHRLWADGMSPDDRAELEAYLDAKVTPLREMAG